MNQELNRLYQRICDYSPDDPESQLSFTQRLARENGWTLNYAVRVLEEYKRFMFLAVAAGHPVTPSEQVDQAWHLHLVYTHLYWQDFCGEVLGKQVHHGPTKGGPSEQARYRDWYQRTKASYRRLLSDEPPADIWPDVGIRFGDDLQWTRINRCHNWIIPKPSAKRFLLVGLGSLVLLATVVLMFHRLRQQLPSESSKRLFRGGFPRNTVRDSDDWVRHAVFSGQATYQTRKTYCHHPSSIPQRYDARRHFLNDVPRRKTKSGEPLLYVIIATFIVLAIICHMVFGNRCSSCGRSQAMKKTAKSERGEGLFASTKYELKCKHCGATKWEASGAGGCGGCGDGGCGGCGGCGG